MAEKFKTWRNGRFRSPSNTGDRVKITYTAKYADDGTLDLIATGKEDLYDYIQSFADSCDINTILKRFENGEVDVLNRVEGFFFDVSEVPANMADLLNKLNHAESEFDKMPVEFKEKYGYDFARFLCSFDPNDFVSSVVVPDEPILDPIEKEVKSDES